MSIVSDNMAMNMAMHRTGVPLVTLAELNSFHIDRVVTIEGEDYMVLGVTHERSFPSHTTTLKGFGPWPSETPCVLRPVDHIAQGA